MPDLTLNAVAQKAGLDLSAVKAGLLRILPIVEPIVRLTPNKFDDAAVAFLKSLLLFAAPPAAGFDWATVKTGLQRVLPLLELIARHTQTELDDAVVAFVRAALAETA